MGCVGCGLWVVGCGLGWLWVGLLVGWLIGWLVDLPRLATTCDAMCQNRMPEPDISKCNASKTQMHVR